MPFSVHTVSEDNLAQGQGNSVMPKKPFKNIKVIYTYRQGEDIVGCENTISLSQRRSKRITARRYKYDI